MWRKPPLGRLRHRVTLQHVAETADALGQADADAVWTDAQALYALVEPAGVGESVTGQQVRADATHRVTLRAGVTITAKMRLTWNGRVLNVVGVEEPDEAWRVVSCQEQPSEAGA